MGVSKVEDEVSSPVAAGRDLLTQSISFLGLPGYIISSFFPDIWKHISKYPRLVRALSLPLAIYFLASYGSGKLYTLWHYLMTHCMASATITGNDTGLNAAFSQFLETKRLYLAERDVSAYSTTYVRNQTRNIGVTYNKALVTPQEVSYEPHGDLQAFRHGNRFFFLTSAGKHLAGMFSQEYKIWTFGWSPKPIKELIDTAYNSQQKTEKRINTNIYAPQHGQQWALRASRGRRPLSSVYLDRQQKATIMQDIKDYLTPDTAKWYSDRGIPYRRGYLFHGEPGTGKTSLALAIAGHFKLEVYILSLLDISITDSTLQMLFQILRPGIIILLEDVDSAGLGREVLNRFRTTDADGQSDEANDGEDSTGGESMDKAALMKALKSAKKKQKDKKSKKKKPQRSGVTLSGLLNAIDGAGAPEGHILVMTSNKPDSLDDALVRAGRVDVRVRFEYASKSQIRDIFINMYKTQQAIDGDSESANEYEEKVANVKRLAQVFAMKVPSRKLSPAQLQDFILMNKTDPAKAIEKVEEWMRKDIGLSVEEMIRGVEEEEEELDEGQDDDSRKWSRSVSGDEIERDDDDSGEDEECSEYTEELD